MNELIIDLLSLYQGKSKVKNIVEKKVKEEKRARRIQKKQYRNFYRIRNAILLGDLNRFKRSLRKLLHEEVNEKDKRGMTLLMYAVQMDEMTMVQELLMRGADLSIVNKDGRNAIMLGTILGFKNIIKGIINFEETHSNKHFPHDFLIYFRQRDRLNKTAYDYAWENNMQDLVNLLPPIA